MTKTTILILGGGGMQVPGIQIANKMNWTTIVADGVPYVPGREYADYFENIDLKDTERMIQAALKYKNSIGLDGVFTAGTDFSETVARVASAADLPGISIQASINASNKEKMREAFKIHNIPSPLFFTVNKNRLFNKTDFLDKGFEFPLVVKPVDNMGSRGIRRTDNIEELEIAVNEAFLFSRSGTVIIEEYLDGAEFSIDALIYENKITICGFADRHIFYPPYFIEMGHTIPSSIDKKMYKEIITTFKAAVRALGITEGAAKGDIRLNKGKVYIGEIAARLSGGYMSGWTFPYSSGVELTKEALKIAVGRAPTNLLPIFNKTTAERAFLSIPGKIIGISGIEEAKSEKHIFDLFLRVKTGLVVKFPENNVEKAGNCIAVNKNRAIAIRSAEDACRKIFIRLEACNKITEEFIFGNYQVWVKNAFILNENINIEALEKMPDFELSRANNIGILTLPELLQESAKEWHGKAVEIAFKEVIDIVSRDNQNINIPTVLVNKTNSYKNDTVDLYPDGVVLGKFFYRAFLRGGVQGGVWVIDTIRKTIEERKNLLELFSRWKEY